MLPTIPSLRQPEYQISNSLRFRSSASAYLSKVVHTAGDYRTSTWSGWVKRGAFNAANSTTFWASGAGVSSNVALAFTTSDQLMLAQNNPTQTIYRISTAVYRDPSAWYHIVFVLDTNNPTAQNRARIWVNGVEITSWATNTTIPLGTTFWWNAASSTHTLGSNFTTTPTQYFDGYLAEVNFIDGQALTPAAFGATSSKTGVWAPRKYLGTYGTNGFYLKYSDNSSTTAIGYDSSNGTGALTTPYAANLTTNNSGWDTLGVRMVLTNGAIQQQGKSFRITLKSGSNGLNVQGVKFGVKASSGNAWDFAGDQVSVTFGGLTTSSMGNNATLTSDWMVYPAGIAASGAYVVALAIGPTNGTTLSGSQPTTGSVNVYTKTGDYASGALTTAPTGYSNTANNPYFISALEVQGNNMISTNISLVAGVNYDSMTDTPTPYGDAAYYSGWNPSYGLQFRSSASTYLSRTPASGSNQTTWTWSGWIKRTSVSGLQTIFSAGQLNTYPDTSGIDIVTTGVIRIFHNINGTTQFATITNELFNSVNTWYHIVVCYDSTQQISSNRITIFVNGVSKSTTGTYPPSLNYTTYINQLKTHLHGAIHGGASVGNPFDGILADVNFIDGQALTPSSFGETNSTGTWVPKTYTGTYGTNGFYLNFANRSAMTAAAIGDDASSNNNQWTPNNMGPTDAIDYGVKTARGNYAVLNPVNAGMASTIFGGNLTFAGISNTNAGHVASTIGVDSGAYYFEFIPSSFTGILEVYLFAGGIAPGSVIVAGYRSNGTKDVDDVNSAYGAAWTAVDHIGCAFNVSTKTVTFYKNNVSQGTFSYVTTGALYPAIAVRGTGSANGYVNFGQRPFAYTPPAGFKALCTQNLPDPAIVHGHAYMAATTYTGTGVGRNISNFSNNRSFRPDLVWIKSRSNATDHALYDTLRGAQQDLVSNSTAAETTQSTGLTAFREDGFGLSTLTKLNSAGNTYVAWQWKAGDSTVTNTAGSITSQVDAGTTQGVSVVTYTGTGANATVGHGLGVAPSMVIVKSRTTGSWQVRHNSIAAANSIQLNSPNQAAAAATVWNSTAPTSSVFSIGTSTDVNASGVGYVTYCFAEIAGYSKFGSYAGNSSTDGPFVFCGFRPRWILIKAIGTVADGPWCAYDSSRPGWNVDNAELGPNHAFIETDNDTIDILSNGFKLRTVYQSKNLSGITYIFAAFAEVPSKYALAR